jgi:glycosyltransferase involved in cell wall biosynthesis
MRFRARERITPEILNICFVSQEYPEETGWGGIGTYTFEMAHGLARAGHKAIVISRALDHEQHYIEDDGVEVFRILPSLNLNSTPMLWRLNHWWEGYRLAVAIKLRQILRQQQIDVIESPELHAETLLHSMFKTQPPLVVRLHSGSRVVRNVEADGSNAASLDSRAERRLIRKAAHVTSPSLALRNSVNGERGSRPLTVIPNPVDVDHFKPDSDLRPSDSAPNILCVGRPRFLKGIHVLAGAMPRIWSEAPNAIFTFAPAPMGKGGGYPREAYRELLGNLMEDSRVRILDPVSRAQMPDVYRSATICVVPSLWEGFGYVAAEAMASGTAVIASRIGGLAEIVEDDRFGVLVEPGNAEELAQSIVSLICDRERRAQIGIQARERIGSEFSRVAITERMAKLYHEVVASRKA